MRTWADSTVVFSAVNRVRKRRLGVLPALFLACLTAFGGAASGQTQLLAQSDLAGVTFPEPSGVWFPDPQRTQATALNAVATSVGRSCAATEFHIWDVANEAAAEDLQTRTNVAFTQAGWALEVISAADAVEHAYLAQRGDAELLMDWVPREGEDSLGLLLCVVGPAPAAATETVPRAEVRAADGTPMPHPRPDPDAPVVAPEPAVAPAATPLAPAASVFGAGTPAIAATEAAAPIASAAIPAVSTGDAATTGGSSWSIGLLAVTLVLAVAAFFLVRLGLKGTGNRASRNWPTAIASVVYSQVASETTSGTLRAGSTRYVPVVAYEYHVDGTNFRAARLKFGDSAKPSLADAKRITDRYPIGAGIEIRYNPARPAEAVIEGAPDRMEALLIVGVALAVFALASLIIAIA